MDQSVRYKRLQEIANRSLRESTRELTLEQLLSCYPNIAASTRGKQALEKALAQFTEIWHKTATKEFNAIFEERAIEMKLAELEELIRDAQARKNSASSGSPMDAPSKPVHIEHLTPQHIVDSNLKTLKRERLRNLQQKLSSVTQENELLETELRANQHGLTSATNGLAASLDQLQNSVNAGQKLPTRAQLAQLADLAVPPVPTSKSNAF